MAMISSWKRFRECALLLLIASAPENAFKACRAVVDSTSMFLALFAALVLFCLYRIRQTPDNLPPSPTPHPLWGHAKELASACPWKHLADLSKDLGSIIYLQTFGQPIIVIGSADVARDLMEKRGSKYSSRAGLVSMDMWGLGDMLAFLPYGDRFRTQRRMMQQTFNSQAVKAFRDTQFKQIVTFLDRLLKDPTSFSSNLRMFIEATVLKATYGHDVLSEDDKYIKLAVGLSDATQDLEALGASPADMLPILRYLPPWLPGMGFKRAALIGREKVQAVIDTPFEDQRATRGKGIRGPSLLERLMDDYEASGKFDLEYEINAKNATAVIYAAAGDTSFAVTMVFLWMMTLHPEEVKRAQAEIDAVVGNTRLPTFEDRSQLPYIDCILKEVLRIHPPVPLGLSHKNTEEDFYNGKRIPVGSVIMPNIWQMMHDQKYFDRSDDFKPERFLEKVKSYENSDQPLNGFTPEDPSSVIFGFGRRICPGRYFADANLWLFIACFLAVFDVACHVNPETGLEEEPEMTFSSGIAPRPSLSRYRISCRSEMHSKLVEDAVDIV